MRAVNQGILGRRPGSDLALVSKDSAASRLADSMDLAAPPQPEAEARQQDKHLPEYKSSSQQRHSASHPTSPSQLYLQSTPPTTLSPSSSSRLLLHYIIERILTLIPHHDLNLPPATPSPSPSSSSSCCVRLSSQLLAKRRRLPSRRYL